MSRTASICFLMLVALPILADTPPPPKPAPATVPEGRQAGATAVSGNTCQRPTLTAIHTGSGRRIGRLASGTADSPGAPIYLGQWITLKGCNLNLLKSTPEKPLQLYLNGMPLKGSDPVILQRDGEMSGVRFELVRTDESKDTWAALLGRPKTGTATVNVSLGVQDCREGCTAMTNPLPVQLIALRPGWAFGYLFVLFLLLVLLLWLARTRGMLRDRGPGSPWSLARTQMAWWTFFVVGAFLFIWMVSGSYSSLSNSVLALLGISSGTALLGTVIDDTKENQRQQKATLEAERNTLQARVSALPPAETQRLADLDQQIRELPAIVQQAPRNFLFDILSDEDGVSFHRFQIAIWTVVLTAIFVVRVYSTLAMPDFDAQLLGLTGISAGTYLGFKFPEKKV